MIEDFPLNAKFIYEEPTIIIEANRCINFVTYLIRDVRESFHWHIGNNPTSKLIFQEYQRVSL